MKRVMAMLVGIVLAWTTIGFAAPLVALAMGGSISGLVTDSSGAPIVGATVRASTDEFGFGASPPVTTDSSGYYSIIDLPADASPWRVAAVAPPPISRPELLPTGGSEVLFAELEVVTRDVDLVTGGTVSGRITDPTGQPVAGATVTASGFPEPREAVTDLNGEYRITGLNGGPVNLFAWPPAGTSLLFTFFGDVTNGNLAVPVDVPPSGELTNQDIQLVQGAVLNVEILGGTDSAYFQVVDGCVGSTFTTAPTPLGYPCEDPTAQAFNAFGDSPVPIGQVNLRATSYAASGILTLSETVSVTTNANVPTDCTFVIGGTATCVTGDPATSDGDGVIPAIEDRAPNAGDGNADGIRDAIQSNVASFPGLGGEYVTMAIPSDRKLTGVSLANSVGQSEIGQLQATTNVEVGGSIEVALYKQSGWRTNRLMTYDWYNAVPLPESQYRIDGNALIVQLTDGQPGDFVSTLNDAVLDGVIGIILTPKSVDITPPIVTCPDNPPIFSQYTSGFFDVTAADYESGLAAPWTGPTPPSPPTTTEPVQLRQFANTSIVGDAVTTVNVLDVAGNVGTAFCPYTVVGDDGDGVPASIEDLAPHDGDGNQDGVLDSTQSNVASLPAVHTYGFVTIESPVGTQISSASIQPFFTNPVGGQVLQTGMIYARVDGDVSGDVDVRLIRYDQPVTANQFLTFNGVWTPVPVTVEQPTMTLHLHDGQTGDHDAVVNGSITIYGAPSTGDTTPPTIVCDASSFRQGTQYAYVTATLSDQESGVYWPYLSVWVDASMIGSFWVELSGTDIAGNQATQLCEFTVTDDGDGVPAEIENAAPNDGDGNSDGVRDSSQSNVSSLPGAVVGGYATIVSYSGDLTDVTVEGFDGTPLVPPRYTLEPGLYRFTVHGTFVTPSIIRSWASAADTVLTPVSGTWEEIWYAYDGSAWDLDGPYNGTITLEVAFVERDLTPPTIVCPLPPSFLLNQPDATISATVSDSGSGVANQIVETVMSTTMLGPNSGTVLAVDLAGNVGHAWCDYEVGVELDRLITPTPSISTIVKANRTVPIHWRAVDFYGQPVSDPSHFIGVDSASTACVRGRLEVLHTVANQGLRYLGDGQWEYDWTTPAQKGCYTLQLLLRGASGSGHVRVN